jgi:glycerophosphoryl diester phosphodiesterase
VTVPRPNPTPEPDRGGGYFAPPLPRILAHRGFAQAGPEQGAVENTLGAFRRAVEAGAAYLETDVHGSSDGIAVISHDPDLQRLTGRQETVSQFTAAALAELDLGSGEGMPSLKDALLAFPGMRFNIDVKSEDAIEGTIAAVREAGAADRILITSFSEARRSAVARELRGAATSASAPRFCTILALAKLGLLRFFPVAHRGIDAVQVPTHVSVFRVTTPRVIRAVHRAGLEIHIWTVNEPADMIRLVELGVDGIVTDRADLAQKALVSGRL